MANRSVGATIRAVRAAQGLTGAEMAQELGISRPSYTQLEGGKRRLSVHILQQIARILDVPIGSLCGELIPHTATVPWRGRGRHLRPINAPDLIAVLRSTLGRDAQAGAAWLTVWVRARAGLRRNLEEAAQSAVAADVSTRGLNHAHSIDRWKCGRFGQSAGRDRFSGHSPNLRAAPFWRTVVPPLAFRLRGRTRVTPSAG